MVRTAGINHESPINLFRQNEAHQLMRHREPAKGNLRIRTFQHVFRQSERATDDKCQIASAIRRQIFNF